jgi:Predicted helicase
MNIILKTTETKGDKSYRHLLGQFYTPKPIVRLMWQLTRDVLKKVKGRDLYEKELPYLDVLDVAYGSGTFLYEGMLQINQCASGKAINNGIVYATLKDRSNDIKVEEHMYGFEINPLSKSIADINIFIALIQLYGVNGELLKKYPIERIKLFRTDSYDLKQSDNKKIQQESLLFMSEDAEEAFREKEEIMNSKNKKYDIIITNPPYGEKSPTRFIKSNLIPFAYAENNFDNLGNEVNFNWNKTNFQGQVPSSEKK